MKKVEKTAGQLPLETDLITRTGPVGNAFVVLADHRAIRATVGSAAHGAEEVSALHEDIPDKYRSIELSWALGYNNLSVLLYHEAAY